MGCCSSTRAVTVTQNTPKGAPAASENNSRFSTNQSNGYEHHTTFSHVSHQQRLQEQQVQQPLQAQQQLLLQVQQVKQQQIHSHEKEGHTPGVTVAPGDEVGQNTAVTTAVSVAAVIDEEKETVAEAEVSYAEFPTHTNLRQANVRYAAKRKDIPRNADGTLRPFPGYRKKSEIFNENDFVDLDKYADEAPHAMMRRPVEEIVSYLNKKCTSDLHKARAYFRWLATRNIEHLIPLDDQIDDDHAVLKTLYEIKSTSGSEYTNLFADMCRHGGLQIHIIKGKVRTSCEVDESIDSDNFLNDWVAVAIDNEWRFIDVHFASMKRSAGPGEWQLIDDNGKGHREVDDAPEGVSYQLDEFYFLTDPENFIYNHRPLLDEWQLLARPVTLAEFKEMAWLRCSFFDNGLAVGSRVKKLLKAFDGEVEIDINLPQGQRRRFMYQLWRSTKQNKMQNFENFALSQFVLLQQKNNRLHCDVSFPARGDYKLQLFVRSDEDGELENGTYACACVYLIQVEEAKEEWNAFPKNPRNEWGFSHEMSDLGLVPITHPDAIIETDDGNLEIRFKCTKDPVDCLLKLRGLKLSEDELARCLLYRQNEDKELVIYIKLPERGYYALDIYGKRWGVKDTFSLVSTYLIASSTAAYNQQPFPDINNQMSGQQSGNIEMQMQAVSHRTSVVVISETKEMKLEFATPREVEITTHLYHWLSEAKEECTEYSFIARKEDRVDFFIRFVYTGMYTFEIFAKPCGAEGSFPHVFTYVFFVLQSNPEWVPYPKIYNKWGPGCEIEGLSEGHLAVGENREVKMLVPDAEKVAFVSEDNEWIHLQKDEENIWNGNVKIEKEGKMNVFANYGEGNNYNALLECEVKSAKILEAEKQERRLREKELQEKLNQKKKEEDQKKRILEQQFEETRKELMKAIEDRNVEMLKKAIGKVERNNYTKRLEKEYQEAKALKKSLDKIARLKALVVSMDTKLMAVIRSYANPPPLVHATMRATFLLLGNQLKETKDWKRCQALCNTIELNKRIRAFDIINVSKENANKSRNILDPIRIEDVQDTSEGAATFYIWTLGMTEEVLQHRK